MHFDIPQPCARQQLLTPAATFLAGGHQALQHQRRVQHCGRAIRCNAVPGRQQLVIGAARGVR